MSKLNQKYTILSAQDIDKLEEKIKEFMEKQEYYIMSVQILEARYMWWYASILFWEEDMTGTQDA